MCSIKLFASISLYDLTLYEKVQTNLTLISLTALGKSLMATRLSENSPRTAEGDTLLSSVQTLVLRAPLLKP